MENWVYNGYNPTYRGYNPHLYTTSKGPDLVVVFLFSGCNHSIGQRYLHYFIDENFRFQKSQGLQGHSGSSLFHYFIISLFHWISGSSRTPRFKKPIISTRSAKIFVPGDSKWPWLVVSTHLKNISRIGNLPQIGVKIKNVWNQHLGPFYPLVGGHLTSERPSPKKSTIAELPGQHLLPPIFQGDDFFKIWLKPSPSISF